MRRAYPSQCGDGSRKLFVWECDGGFWEWIWTVHFLNLGRFYCELLGCILINDWSYLLIPSSVLLRCGVMQFGPRVRYQALPKTRCKTPPDRRSRLCHGSACDVSLCQIWTKGRKCRQISIYVPYSNSTQMRSVEINFLANCPKNPSFQHINTFDA